jgi:hypothetical protein
MLVIADLHIKEKEPFLSAIKKLFEDLNTFNPDEILVFLGDEFDNSSPSWSCFALFAEFISSRKNDVYILNGNHTYSKRKGFVLEGFSNFKNVHIILTPTVYDIEGKKCLFLPYLEVDNKVYYTDYKFSETENFFDYIFTHLTPWKVAFGEEGIDFNNLKGTFIHGHIHMQLDFKDDYENKHMIVGVPIPTRHLEQLQKHRILEIKNGNVNIIYIPQYFTYETLQFGEEPSNKNNILNVKNVPSWEALYKTYRQYHIREEGVEFIKNEDMVSFENSEFEQGGLKQKFNIFRLDRGLSNEVTNKCLEYIDKYENKTNE